MIDPGMKWSEYKGSTLYLWNGDTLYAATEDSENIHEIDEAMGYKDSWIVDIYTLQGEVPQGGQWMETEMISDLDYTLEGIIDRLSECDLWEDDWQILDPFVGRKLQFLFLHVEEYANALRKSRKQLEDFLAEKDLVGKEGANGSEF